jgi:hypothetical protein
VFIRCHSNGCQHMPYRLQHARHSIFGEMETGWKCTDEIKFL